MIALRALLLGWGDLLRPRILSLVLTGIALTLVLFVLVSLLFPDPAADQAALMSDDSNAETVS